MIEFLELRTRVQVGTHRLEYPSPQVGSMVAVSFRVLPEEALFLSSLQINGREQLSCVGNLYTRTVVPSVILDGWQELPQPCECPPGSAVALVVEATEEVPVIAWVRLHNKPVSARRPRELSRRLSAEHERIAEALRLLEGIEGER